MSFFAAVSPPVRMKRFPLLGPLAWALLLSCSSTSTEEDDSHHEDDGTGGSYGIDGSGGGNTGGTVNGSGGLTSAGGTATGGNAAGGELQNSGGGTSSGGTDPGSGGMTNSGGMNGDGDAPISGGAPNQGTSDCDLPELDSPLGSATTALKVLNWAGKNAAISYTFDDSHSSQVSNYNALNALGVPFTFYLTTNWIGGSLSTWIQAKEDGHEIGNHTETHPETANNADIDKATKFIQDNIHVTPLTMAAPNGNPSYSSPAMSRFLFNRGVGGGSIAPLSNVNRYSLPTFIPPPNADKNALDSGVSGAISQGHWQTVTIHGFSGGAFQAISLDGFLQHVEGQRDSNKVWIDSLVAVGSYFIGQKLLDDANPSQEGAASTWSWTLPDHFPEGRCLRIQSTGSVSQNGTPVPEHAMGYYDISLDEGQVTVQP